MPVSSVSRDIPAGNKKLLSFLSLTRKGARAAGHPLGSWFPLPIHLKASSLEVKSFLVPSGSLTETHCSSVLEVIGLVPTEGGLSFPHPSLLQPRRPVSPVSRHTDTLLPGARVGRLLGDRAVICVQSPPGGSTHPSCHQQSRKTPSPTFTCTPLTLDISRGHKDRTVESSFAFLCICVSVFSERRKLFAFPLFWEWRRFPFLCPLSSGGWAFSLISISGKSALCHVSHNSVSPDCPWVTSHGLSHTDFFIFVSI